MSYFAVIINPDKVQRGMLKHQLEAVGKVEFKEFESDTPATEWLTTEVRKVDFVFLSWSISKTSHQLVTTLRSLAHTKDSLLFMIASPEDYNWIKAIFGLGNQIDSILVKPFRPGALSQRLKALLSEEMAKKSCALLVDDDAASREIIRKYLRQFGFAKVLEASDGDEGFKILQDNGDEVAIVVSDWEMPHSNGIQLLRKIRRTAKHAELPFIMITSQTSIEEVKTIQAAEVGVDGYLNKPFDLKTFKAQMDSIFQEITNKRKSETYLIQGRTLLAQGNTFKAIEILTEGTNAMPESSALHEALGDAYSAVDSETGKNRGLGQAATAYEKALKLNPLKTALVMKCFEVHTVLGQMNDAIRVLKEHLTRLGLNDDLRTRLGKIYLQNGLYSAASAELKRALNVNPSNTEAQSLYQIALSLGQGDDIKKAG